MIGVLESIMNESMGCSSVRCVSKSQGALNNFSLFETDKGKFFVKVNDKDLFSMYESEAKGLQALKETKTIRVPNPCLWGVKENISYLIMEYIPLSPHTSSSQRELGIQLAKMHLLTDSMKFGFFCDNTIGTTPQINPWTEDWIKFFIENRLRYQLRLVKKNWGDDELFEKGEQLIEVLPSFFEGIEVVPSLLHGDLWGGNTAADDKGHPVVFDPATYYGHHEAEFGILLMFGGFTKEFHEAYRELIPKEKGFDERQRAYQLYHYLNHYNLFGSAYRSTCLKLTTL